MANNRIPKEELDLFDRVDMKEREEKLSVIEYNNALFHELDIEEELSKLMTTMDIEAIEIIQRNISQLRDRTLNKRAEYLRKVDEIYINDQMEEEFKESQYKNLADSMRLYYKNLVEEQIQLHNRVIEIKLEVIDKAMAFIDKHDERMKGLSVKDYAFIKLMLKRDNSSSTKKTIAERYNFKSVVLDVLNADGNDKFIHPLIYMDYVLNMQKRKQYMDYSLHNIHHDYLNFTVDDFLNRGKLF